MWGYAIGTGLMMFVFSLIFLGLLALIPPLQRPYAWRHVLAWILGSLLIGYLSGNRVAFAPLVIGSLLCGVLMWVRYWWVTRKQQAATGSE
jgi:hypothetical protein